MSTQTVWSISEESALLDFLVEHRSEAGDNGNFKKSVFERAAMAIAPLLTKGAPKQAKSAQNKWGAMRKTYRTICAIKAVSGWTWDEAAGASITPELASTWNDYVAKHPEAKPFRNRGWVHYAKVATLMPSATSTTNVFHPLSSQDVQGLEDDVPDPTSTQENIVEEASSSDHDEDSPAVPAITGKRSREPSTPTPAPKRVRASAGATALSEMAASVTRFGDAIAAALAPPANAINPTPRRRMDAISAARKHETWLHRLQLILLIDILRKDKTACDTYLSIIDDDDLRMEWVALQINIPSPNTSAFI